jgi:hypothetical protein
MPLTIRPRSRNQQSTIQYPGKHRKPLPEVQKGLQKEIVGDGEQGNHDLKKNWVKIGIASLK